MQNAQKKLKYLTFFSLFFSSSLFGLPDLSALAEAEKQTERRQLAEKAAAEAKLKAERLAKENARLAKQKKLEAERMRKQKAKEDEAKRIRDERLADKYRNQAYEDELRQLELEERKMMLKAKLKRADDYISAELDNKKADIDVKQSKADERRSISEGRKTLMEKTGDALIEEAKNPRDVEVNLIK